MSRIDIAELNDFLHGLRSSNAEAKEMIRKIKEAAMDYSQDDRLKGEAVSASKQYFSSTYTRIAQSIIEALNESEERLAQYIREFGSQVDSSPSARIDAEILQEAMAQVRELQRKEEDLHRQLTAPNTKPDMQQVYAIKSRSVHTQLLKAIEKENILEKYLAFEQSHGQFFSALVELIRATGHAVQELLHNVTFDDKTGTYSVPKSTANSLQLMKKALDTARKENDKDPFPKAFEDYAVLAYTYVNDQGETVTMWLLEKDGKRVENKELQDFLEKNGLELDPLLYTSLSGEELERKVNDSWKEGINYLNGQKVSGFSGATLRSSAYVASMKDWTDDAGLTDMALGLGFGIAAARNKTVIKEKLNLAETKQTVNGEKWNNYFKEKYGAGNVQWKPSSFEDIIINPERLYGSTKKEVRQMLGEGWREDSYGRNGLGWKFTNEGDGMVFYHAGGGVHKSSYYGYSTGPTGKVKIIKSSDGYIPTLDDTGKIITID
ncbi:LXG domain-containing protein [Listeria innocua]|uniref:LXG domain-containing protein n=1 Tax=Listeria innocua TaxID=1642 RepID=UPI00188817C5|nr:LXG domain-containing protein [Listeria innocua]MBF2442458.1 LXG domain-containing protein [Listeria innocua]MBF2659812.1 LXG domain-containing protein [Listeria innocua]